MRKINKNIVDTIKAQRNDVQMCVSGNITVPRLIKTFDNTRIETGLRADGAIVTSVYLHNNLIAQYSGLKAWGFKMCGWPTPTTKSRINAIAGAFGHTGVCTRKGKHYSGDTEVSAVDWF